MKKLSKTQIEVLRKLAEPGAVAHYMPYMGWFRKVAYWSLSRGRTTEKTMQSLIKLGFVGGTPAKFGADPSVIITPAGREVLADLEKGE